MAHASSDSFEMDGGHVRAWIEQRQSFCLKIVTPEGDPVELAEHELQRLIEGLQRLSQRLKELEGD
jgi:hypothetical protein